MNKTIMLILTSLLLLFLAACGTKTQQAQEPLKIGFIAPLTGDVANYGEASRNGLDLALEEINSAGGINGRTIAVIYEDGKCNGKDANSAAQKLIDVDEVQIITGTVCSSETLAVAPLAEQNNVILVSVASSSPDITKSGDFIFRVWPSDVGQASVMAQYLKDEGITKVGILHTNSDYNLGLARAFTKDFKALGGTVVATETYEQDAKDFKTQILKIKNKNPEAFYVVPYGEGGLLAKQVRELGIELPIVASETFGTQEILNDAGDAAEGVIYATPKFDEATEATKTFLDKYKAKYNKDSPFAVISASAYDALNIIVEGLKQGAAANEELKTYLYNVKNYPGVSGTITIDQNGDALKDFQLMQIKDGKFIKYAENK